MSAKYSWPRSRAFSAIARIVWPPSDQSEWPCRSPRSCTRSASPASEPGCRRVLEQLLQVLRRVARERFGDDGRGLVAHAGDVLQPADRVEPLELLDRHPLHLVRGAAEGLSLVPGLPAPHEEVGDAVERVGGIHTSNVPFSAWASTPSRSCPGSRTSCSAAVVRRDPRPRVRGAARRRARARLRLGPEPRRIFRPTVTGLWAVDPSGTAMKLAAKRIAATSVPVHPAGLDGARLELPDDRFDGGAVDDDAVHDPECRRARWRSCTAC